MVALTLIACLIALPNSEVYRPFPLLIYSLILGLLIWISWREDKPLPKSFEGWLPFLLLFLSSALHLNKPYLVYADPGVPYTVIRKLTVLIFLLSLFQAPVFRRFKEKGTWALLVMMLTAFTLVPFSSPRPKIDVVVFEKESTEAILDGRNPYKIEYSDVYNGKTNWYPEGKPLSYPYPPVTLILNLFGFAFGDPRWFYLLAHVLTSFFIFRSARLAELAKDQASLVALSYLWLPRSLFQAEQGWVDPAVTLFLSIFSCRLLEKKSKSSIFWLGAALATKQTLVILLLVLRRIYSHLTPRGLILLFSVPFMTLLPFFILSPKEIINDLLLFHLRTPFRGDGMTFSSLWYRLQGTPLPGLFSGFLILSGITSFLLPRKKVNFWIPLAGIYLLILLLSKHAFYNYFYFLYFLLLFAYLFSRKGFHSQVRFSIKHR